MGMPIRILVSRISPTSGLPQRAAERADEGAAGERRAGNDVDVSLWALTASSRSIGNAWWLMRTDVRRSDGYCSTLMPTSCAALYDRRDLDGAVVGIGGRADVEAVVIGAAGDPHQTRGNRLLHFREMWLIGGSLPRSAAAGGSAHRFPAASQQVRTA